MLLRALAKFLSNVLNKDAMASGRLLTGVDYLVKDGKARIESRSPGFTVKLNGKPVFRTSRQWLAMMYIEGCK